MRHDLARLRPGKVGGKHQPQRIAHARVERVEELVLDRRAHREIPAIGRFTGQEPTHAPGHFAHQAAAGGEAAGVPLLQT